MKRTVPFTPERREAALDLAREGWSGREIARRLKTTHHNSRAAIAEIAALGQLPAHCPCGQPRGHRGYDCALSSTNGARRKVGGKPGVSTLNRAQLYDIDRRAAEGQSGRQIYLETGISLVAVQKRVRRWIAENPDLVKPCRCGRPARHPGGCIKNSPSLLTPWRIKWIQQKAREGVSAAEMGRRSRSIADTTSVRTILKYAVPVWEAMAAEGMFCGCGERLGHPGLCIATWDSDGRIRGPQPIPVPLQKRIGNLLLNGDSMNSIRIAAGASWKQVFRVFRAMSAEERHRRFCQVRRRIGDDDGRLHGADLYERVQKLVPRGFEASLRDEVVSELCLAVIQGDVTIDAIRKKVRTFIGRAFTDWANSFRRSTDEQLSDDGDLTLGDLFGDDTMVEMLDDMEIGARAPLLPPPAGPVRSREELFALDVLALDADASIEQAKAAWRRLAKTAHPDANPGDPTAARRFQAIQASWDILRKANEARAMVPA